MDPCITELGQRCIQITADPENGPTCITIVITVSADNDCPSPGADTTFIIHVCWADHDPSSLIQATQNVNGQPVTIEVTPIHDPPSAMVSVPGMGSVIIPIGPA